MKKKQTRRVYSREFKMEAVRLSREPGRKLSDLARELGISYGVLREWRRQATLREGMAEEEVFPGNGHQARQEEEIRQLKKELERVRQERDFLKKAAAYFAKNEPQ